MRFLFLSERCVCIFVTYLQDGFTTYKRAQWHDDALLFVGTMRLYLCDIFARWAYKTTNARSDTMMRCFLSERCVCIFVTYLQDGFTKLQTRAMKRRCVAFVVDWCVCIFVTYLQDGFTKRKRTQWHDDALLFVGTMRLYLCKLFARWVYKIQTHAITRRFVSFFRRIDAFVSL